MTSPDLLTPSEIDALDDPSSPLVAILDWTRRFVMKPHPDLGRAGPVCPFVPGAVRAETMWLTVVRLGEGGRAAVEETLHPLRQVFLRLDPTEGREALFKTIVIVFPDVSDQDAPEFIDGVQRTLKPAFVEDGLMLGQFHPRNEEPGLRNAQFRPLRSPIPLLVIRFMVQTDLPFLTRQADSPLTRLGYVASFLATCRRLDIGTDRLSRDVDEVVRVLRELIDELSAF